MNEVYVVNVREAACTSVRVLSLMDFLAKKPLPQPKPLTPNSTRTYKREDGAQVSKDNFNIENFMSLINGFNEMNKSLFEADRKSLYNSFKIPKRHGGLRQIDAPNKELSEALRCLKEIFDLSIGDHFHHQSAFAYVKQRSCVDAVKVHQQNKSRWFAKFDFSNFFGSTTLDFVMESFKRIYPLNLAMAVPEYAEALKKAISLAFLNGGLPQGTPISPFVTNLMMIPVDFEMSKWCNNRELHRQIFVYTRYADDIVVSGYYDFNYKLVEERINEILAGFNAPFRLNAEKTSYCSSSGKNFILGVMLNKDNNITIGHEKLKHFKAMVNNYILDYKNGRRWNLDDVYHLQGITSWYRSVEPDYIDYIIGQHNKKYSADFYGYIKDQLRNDKIM